MWQHYLETVRTSALDWAILSFGALLILAHLFGFLMRWQGRSVLFVQRLDRYRTVCLLLTELLPVLGLAGTVLSLMNTFQTFQVASDSAPDLGHMLRTFAPALSTTLSGLLMSAPNLLLNALLWLACPTPPAEER